MAMPRFDGGTSLTTSPPILSVPLVMSSSPAISRSSVDFPQPEGPTKTTNSPSSISRSTPLITSTVPKDFLTWLSSTAVIAIVLGHQPFTDPASRPRIRKRCSERNTTSGTRMVMKAEAVRISQLLPREPRRLTSRAVSTSWSFWAPRKTMATSRSFHTHRNWKIENEASAGSDSGRTILTKMSKSLAPSIARRFHDLARQPGDVVAQQIDRQRQAEAGMGDPYPEIGLCRDAEQVADLVVEPEQRDQRHLQRHDEEADHQRQQQRPARELHPGERIGGIGGDQDRDDRRRDRHRQRVDERLADAGRVEHLPVVLEREARRQRGAIEDALAARALERGRRDHLEGAVGIRPSAPPRRRGRRSAPASNSLGSWTRVPKETTLPPRSCSNRLPEMTNLPSTSCLRGGRRRAAGIVALGRGQRRPPARHRELVLVADRADEQAEGRHRPQDDDHHHHRSG